MKLAYMAHPISGDVEANLARAERWYRYFLDEHPRVAITCQWLPCCRVLDDDNPAHRELGIAHDLEILSRCDEIWLCGGKISRGMATEIAHAEALHLHVRDFTPLGDEPPESTRG